MRVPASVPDSKVQECARERAVDGLFDVASEITGVRTTGGISESELDRLLEAVEVLLHAA